MKSQAVNLIEYRPGYFLSYAEYGDSEGYPILIQHGMIASIRSAQLFQRLIDRGARLISMARPGYGASSPDELKTVADWGEIAAALVDRLGLAQFDVLGISSGAPYSYALGYHFAGRVRSLYILSGTPALYDERVLARWPYPVNRNARLAEMQALAADLFFSHLSAADQEQDEIRDSMNHQCFGIGLDLKIRCLNWGFDLSQVKNRVVMRHSRADQSVPLVTAEITAQLLPNCRLQIRETDEHFSQAVLDDFIDSAIFE